MKLRKVIPPMEWMDVRRGVTRVTIDGNMRALIENHMGIKELTETEIVLKSRGGFLTISGANLKLTEARKDSVIAEGEISGVTLNG